MVRPRVGICYRARSAESIIQPASRGRKPAAGRRSTGGHPLMTTRSFCAGLPRRDALRLGTAGLFGLGLTLPRLLELQAAAPPSKRKKDLSLIYLFLHGGLST